MIEFRNTVDHGALRANQIVIIALSLVAFITYFWPAALFTGIVMAIGTAVGKPGFFPVYRFILRPLGLVRPEPLADDPRPHRFAQGFGAAVEITGSVLAAAGLPIPGWALVWVVVLLAFVNVAAGFCTGCFVYYQASRLGLPGFAAEAPTGRAPGMKPAREAD